VCSRRAAWRGGGGGGKRRSHVPIIHFGTTRLAVERRTLRGVDVTLVRSRCLHLGVVRLVYLRTFDVQTLCRHCIRAPSYESASARRDARARARATERERERERERVREWEGGRDTKTKERDDRMSVRQETRVLFRCSAKTD